MASTSAKLTRRATSSWCASASGILSRATTPRRRSITKKRAPITDSSSHSRYERGAGAKYSQSRDSTLCSRTMSWEPGATGPKGGRRSTSSREPKRSR